MRIDNRDYFSFINAASLFEPLGFGTTGNKTTQMMEIAAFLGHVGSKTSFVRLPSNFISYLLLFFIYHHLLHKYRDNIQSLLLLLFWCGYLMSLEKSMLESELNIQCGKAIMQDLHSSGTVQNADEVFFKIDVKYLSKRSFEIELKAIKDMVRFLDDGKKNYLRNQSQSLEPFEIVFKHHYDDLLGKLERLKKNAAELNHINGAEFINLPQDVKYLGKRIFECELKATKDMVRILLDGKKTYLRKQSHSLEPFEIVYKHDFDDLLGKLERLKKTAAELNHINGACDISELINQLAGEK